ncbi:MAG: PKD domain-containing protein [Candidatus Micrarchaeota archaeon]|nr:PKD domain-containing protein [Candidatus Micrarchaeota archaeon]
MRAFFPYFIFGPGSANASQESTWALQCVVFDPYNSDGHCTASYQWGDGTTTNGAYSGNNYPSAPHTYSAAGTYTITGTGTDTMGSTVTKTKSVTVN